jgi:fused signal recognition particle receptor
VIDSKEQELYQRGLEKTRGSIWGRIMSVFRGKSSIGEEELEQLEEILITGDVGMQYTMKLVEDLRRSVMDDLSDVELRSYLRGWVEGAVDVQAPAVEPEASTPTDIGPRVTLIVGVNGTGKTTTIGKLAHRYEQTGRSTMVVAADTYRAAAVKQLQIWSERSGALFFGGHEGGDPAAVVHDALTSALRKGVNRVFIDTAGRLHTKEPLMRELEKIKNVAAKIIQDAPHEVLLVLDATTGQNALVQAREFVQAVGVTGLVITKMDGSARGGILIPVAGELGLPVLYVGLGEGLEDLVPFDAREYAKGLIGE